MNKDLIALGIIYACCAWWTWIYYEHHQGFLLEGGPFFALAAPVYGSIGLVLVLATWLWAVRPLGEAAPSHKLEGGAHR